MEKKLIFVLLAVSLCACATARTETFGAYDEGTDRIYVRDMPEKLSEIEAYATKRAYQFKKKGYGVSSLAFGPKMLSATFHFPCMTRDDKTVRVKIARPDGGDRGIIEMFIVPKDCVDTIHAR